MGFFGFGGGSPEKSAAQGRSEDAVYRGEISPIDGADPSQPIEFSLTPEESEEAQRGLLAAKEAAGRIDTERIEVSREHIFGEQTERAPAEPIGTPRSAAFIEEAEHFAAEVPVTTANPGNQGNGEERIRFDLNPEPIEASAEGSDEEPVAPSVMGGF